jgi:hypothetical protein
VLTGGAFSVELVLIEASFVPVVVVLVFVSCAGTSHALAINMSAIAPKRESVLTFVLPPKEFDEYCVSLPFERSGTTVIHLRSLRGRDCTDHKFKASNTVAETIL